MGGGGAMGGGGVMGGGGALGGGGAWHTLTVTTTAVRGLSQPFVWLTYQVVVPSTAVDGTGATGSPTPPLETVYQSSPLPVAESAEAGEF